jgi:hypothetical protein
MMYKEQFLLSRLIVTCRGCLRIRRRNFWTGLKESTYLGRGISQHPAPSKEVLQQVFHNPGKSQSVGFNPVGQEVGRATTVRQVVDQLIEEYHDAVERLNELMEK